MPSRDKDSSGLFLLRQINWCLVKSAFRKISILFNPEFAIEVADEAI